MFEDEAGQKKILEQKKSFGQFLIWILIQDSDPDSNPDPKLTSGRIRIRNKSFGSATLIPNRPDTDPHHRDKMDRIRSASKWIRIRINLLMTSQNVRYMENALFRAISRLSLYLEAGIPIRIRNRIKVKSWIGIRIKVTSRIQIRIRFKVSSRIRIHPQYCTASGA